MQLLYPMVALILCPWQSPGPGLQFPVASVKLQSESVQMGPPVMRGGPGTADPGLIRYSGVTLMTLITKAYSVYPDQVLGPNWLASTRYTLEATIPVGASKQDLAIMLRNLLVGRFQLILRKERKDFTVYNLVPAKGGPKLRRSSVAEDQWRDDIPDPPRTLPIRVRSDANGCPVIRGDAGRSAVGRVGEQNCTSFIGYSISQLVKVLEMMVAFETGSYFGPQASQAHIVDRTGLEGTYDFNLKHNVFARTPGSMLNVQAAAGEAADPVGGEGLFKAVEQQLGLKLEKARSNLGVLVVQNALKVPTAN